MFEVAHKLAMPDPDSVTFAAVTSLDQFYMLPKNLAPHQASKDLQLTAVTCIFIQSKCVEVEPLDLKTCCKTLCHNKFSRQQFLDREQKIRHATMYENDLPHIFDFVLFYIRMIKQ